MSKDLGDLSYEEFRQIRLRQSQDDLQRLTAVVGAYFEGTSKRNVSSDLPTRAETEEEVAKEEAVEPVEVADHVKDEPPAKKPRAKKKTAPKKPAQAKSPAKPKREPETSGFTWPK